MARDNEPDVRIEGWLKTLGIESLCQWDILVFLDRHPSLLIGAQNIPFFLGYAMAQAVAALDSLDSLGLVERSRDSQGVRLYEVTAPTDPARRDALARLMLFADGHTVRPRLARRLRGIEPSGQNKNDSPLPGMKGSEHD